MYNTDKNKNLKYNNNNQRNHNAANRIIQNRKPTELIFNTTPYGNLTQNIELLLEDFVPCAKFINIGQGIPAVLSYYGYSDFKIDKIPSRVDIKLKLNDNLKISSSVDFSNTNIGFNVIYPQSGDVTMIYSSKVIHLRDSGVEYFQSSIFHYWVKTSSQSYRLYFSIGFPILSTEPNHIIEEYDLSLKTYTLNTEAEPINATITINFNDK